MGSQPARLPCGLWVHVMTPLLVVPPAPARWPALEDLLRHKGQPWLGDMQQRLVRGVPGAQDVFAVMPAGSQLLGSATVNKYGDLGVLAHCYVRPEHRERGLMHRLLETALSWFDMTGGHWLFLGTTADLEVGLYGKHGFEPLRRMPWTPHDRVTMLRRGRGVTGKPYADAGGAVEIREIGRAEWPAMVALLQYRPGLDPRVALDESAVSAELFTLDLIDHQERGAYRLLGAFRGSRLVGLATLATERPGERTHAMLVPHTDAPAELRAAIEALAHDRGYAHVEFPMEALAATAQPAAVRAEPPPEAGQKLESAPEGASPPPAAPPETAR
ncbi:MAG: GNAT family N-acetyltransferase [Planctomycetota bacterium]